MLFWEIPTPLWVLLLAVTLAMVLGFLLGVAAAQRKSPR